MNRNILLGNCPTNMESISAVAAPLPNVKFFTTTWVMGIKAPLGEANMRSNRSYSEGASLSLRTSRVADSMVILNGVWSVTNDIMKNSCRDRVNMRRTLTLLGIKRPWCIESRSNLPLNCVLFPPLPPHISLALSGKALLVHASYSPESL